jgi:hypothetical protein
MAGRNSSVNLIATDVTLIDELIEHAVHQECYQPPRLGPSYCALAVLPNNFAATTRWPNHQYQIDQLQN